MPRITNAQVITSLEQTNARVDSLSSKFEQFMAWAQAQQAGAPVAQEQEQEQAQALAYHELAAQVDYSSFPAGTDYGLAKHLLEYAIFQEGDQYPRGVLVFDGHLPTYADMYTFMGIDAKADGAKAKLLQELGVANFYASTSVSILESAKRGAPVTVVLVVAAKGGSINTRVIDRLAAMVLES